MRFLAAQNRMLTEDYDTLTIGLSEDVKNADGVYASRLEVSVVFRCETNLTVSLGCGEANQRHKQAAKRNRR